MRKPWLWFLAMIMGFNGLCAEFNRPITSFDVSAGYRHDNYRWFLNQDIDFNGKTTSCSSSESSSSSSSCNYHKLPLYRVYWEHLQIYELSARGSYQGCNNYYIRVNGNYGWIYDGKNRNSSNTNLLLPGDETARIEAHVRPNRGHVADIEGGVGYSFTSNWRRCIVTPMVGWSYNQQEFFSRNPKQEINYVDIPPLLGSIPNLSFRYKPRWYGFWAGADVLVSVETPCVLLFGSAEYHWAQYHAKGHWNFNDEFIDTFTHRSNGHGFVGYIGFNYRLRRCWYIGLVGAYRNWQFGKGKHRTKFLFNDLADPDQAFGTMPTIPIGTHGHIRKVKWNSWSASLTIAYRYWIWDQ